MKSTLLNTGIGVALITTITFTNSVKHNQCKCPDDRKAPIANAGRDTTIHLPANSVILNASASYDPDGIIVAYHWSKRAGRNCHITEENVVQTEITDLIEGEYLFELEIRDNSGQIAKTLVAVHVVRQ
jgi:hypothetical protein